MSGPVLDLRDSPHQDFEARLSDLQFILQALAVRPLDDVNLLLASWLKFTLETVASGRIGLSILRDWSCLRFNGHSCRQMIERSVSYLAEVAAARQLALDDLIELREAVVHEHPDAWTDDFDADALSARECRNTAPDGQFLYDLDDTPAVRRLRRALKSYAEVYPCRTHDALRTPAQVAAAMPAKRVRYVR